MVSIKLNCRLTVILENTTFDKVVFMYVGALTEHGGVKLLVDAFKLAVPRMLSCGYVVEEKTPN